MRSAGALLITAVFNLCAVTYERLTAIVLPMETRLTIFGTKIVMACTWVGGFTLAVPLAVYRTYRVRAFFTVKLMKINLILIGKRMEKLLRNLLQGKHDGATYILACSYNNHCMVSALCNDYLLFSNILEGKL